MPTHDQIRILEDAARPRVLELWRALRPLTSVIRFMQSGAHPDDEKSDMLAALAFRDGINLSYACSTRGEGGQNDIGTEAGADLGALRTREMERACDVLMMRMYWHCESPDDTITDFGFSKSGTDTLGRWGHARTLARFVEIVRTERPDILCPTFLDVPGQHGHHRAMTELAHEVMIAAADPGFASNLPPWQIRKLYLPAASGAGQAYDDTEPPPPVTLTIDGSGTEPMTGWSWERIGQQSRAFHRSQGMGRWVPAGTEADWPLHLAESHVVGPDTALSSGLPNTVGDLAMVPGAEPVAADLRAAQAAIETAVRAFPDPGDVARAASEALKAVRSAMAACPDSAKDEVVHRLQAKDAQLCHVLRLALGAEAHFWVDAPFVTAGAAVAATLEVGPGARASLDLPSGWTFDGTTLKVSADAQPTDPYPVAYDPFSPAAPALVLKGQHDGVSFTCRLPLQGAPVVLPARSARAKPEALVVNLSYPEREVTIGMSDISPAGSTASLDVPSGWTAKLFGEGISLQLPNDVEEGLYTLPLRVDGAPAFTIRRVEHPHIAATATSKPAALRVLAVQAVLPDARVGYIGAGNDRVDHWLRALGADVVVLSVEDLVREDVTSEIDTIVIGIFAMRFRPGLVEAMPALHRWVEAGGTLVTLYHRPWDNWDPDKVPPRRLEVGQPSLRWRVTDEAADVKTLTEHHILSHPNPIGPDDWAGWHKERGLYFAKDWDASYIPLLEMADPDEEPHRGALLAADIGKGRHVHCALILHHQMEHLVPGAFRLMANLIAPRR